MCSGFFQPSYKRGKYLFFKGAEKGQIIVTMRYDLLLLPLLNSYITSISVIVCYNSLQSVKSQIEMVRLEGLEPSRAYAHHPLKMACLPFHHNRVEYKNGASGQNRTVDTRIFSPLLYQLSYRGTFFCKKKWRPRSDLN